MATYTINYTDGNTETVEADSVEYDPSASDYTFIIDGKVAALTPVINVRSVHRQDDIPANQVPLDPDGYPVRVRIEGDFEQFRQQVQDEASAASRVLAGAHYVADQYRGRPAKRSYDGGGGPSTQQLLDFEKAQRRDFVVRLADALGIECDNRAIDLVEVARDLRAERDQARAAIEAVCTLHRPVESPYNTSPGLICADCSNYDGVSTDSAPVAHPCDTVKRIEEAFAGACPPDPEADAKLPPSAAPASTRRWTDVTDPIQLDREQLLPVMVCLMRRQDATQHRTNLAPPLPACPGCGAEPAELTDSVDHTIDRPARLHFRPCGHQFTASDEDILDTWQTARDLVEQQKNRPAGLRVEAACSKFSLEEPHDAHDWFAPVDGPARCPGYSKPDDGPGPEPGTPQTDAEQVQDLKHTLQRVREAVGTDMVLVGCEQHAARIAALETTLRDVLARFVHETHPGRRCKQTGHVDVEAIAGWHAVLNGEAAG